MKKDLFEKITDWIMLTTLALLIIGSTILVGYAFFTVPTNTEVASKVFEQQQLSTYSREGAAEWVRNNPNLPYSVKDALYVKISKYPYEF